MVYRIAFSLSLYLSNRTGTRLIVQDPPTVILYFVALYSIAKGLYEKIIIANFEIKVTFILLTCQNIGACFYSYQMYLHCSPG